MHTIDANSSVPLYQQVRSVILSEIEDGTLSKGEKLPNELALAQKYGVSRITIRKALASLEADEILIRKQGKGTFITSPKTRFTADDQIGFTKTWEMLGKSPRTQLLKLELVTPKKRIRDFLKVNENEPVVSSTRLRFVDDTPISIEMNYYSNALSYIISEDLNGSLFDILINRHGLLLKHSARILTLCQATTEEADLLGVRKHSPLLLFRDRITDNNDNPLLYSKQVYNIDNMEIYLY